MASIPASDLGHRPAWSYHRAPDDGPSEPATVGSVLRQAAERAPDTEALVEGVADPGDRRRWTYRDLLADAEWTAAALLGRFATGERVAVWANNIPEWVVLQMGAALSGMVLVTANPGLTRSEGLGSASTTARLRDLAGRGRWRTGTATA